MLWNLSGDLQVSTYSLGEVPAGSVVTKSGCESHEAQYGGRVKIQSHGRQSQQKMKRGRFQVLGAVDPKIIFEQK